MDEKRQNVISYMVDSGYWVLGTGYWVLYIGNVVQVMGLQITRYS
ncbi:unnamed protein product [marine sediment metagenome]|uniref:Uncharacterized protein n=1 Tax=marine sediment metagenome TaxID=412755 RepID=X1DGB2_9ZZZZ